MGQLQVNSPVNKADKVASAVNGNFAGLDANGNLIDSGHKHSDYITDISGKADKAVSRSITALANGWSNDTPPTQTISVTGITAETIFFAGPGSMTDAQKEAMIAAQIEASGQAAGTITFSCYGEVPEIDLPIQVIILG